jgi:hypothetical protein
VIRIAGLGFQTMAESNAWLEILMRYHQSGLVANVHMVFKHVCDIVAFVDDLLALSHSVESTWAIARQVVAHLQAFKTL